jgi:hypothetical protein
MQFAAGSALAGILGFACNGRTAELPTDAVRLPGPRPAAVQEPLGANAECERCHTAIAEEWRRSRHREAGTHGDYLTALALEPMRFCHECHAPETRELETTTARAALGVACITCHVTAEGSVLAGDRSSAVAPHPVMRSPRLHEPAACGGCHEFGFPGAHRDEPALMQRTLQEHRASPHAGRSCAGCHMPFTGQGDARHRSHAFASVRDPERLRQALEVEAVRRGQYVELTLTPRGTGHAFPTGDLFRRLTLEAVAVNGDRVLTKRHRYLARHFERRRQTNGALALVETYDDRPGVDCGSAPCSSTITLDLGARAETLAIEYRVAYERVLHLQEGSEDLAVVSSRVLLAGGSL